MDELRLTCAEIARRARSVAVCVDEIDAYAQALGPPSAAAAAADVVAAPTPREALARHWLALDAINFGSGWFPTLRKDPGPPPRSGYATIAAAWERHTVRHGPLRPGQMAELSADEVALLLDQDPGHELMELYARSLRDLGRHLLDDFDGDARALVDAARGSAVALATGLGARLCFADRSTYEELSVPFLKRAQIAAADLQRAGVVRWADAARLTMFADNLVPHVLRLDGVLTFADELVARIEAGELIEHGSPEEVEIRACAVHAVELIVAARGGGDTAAAIDQCLWLRGQGPAYKARPRHRSRCTAY